MHLMMYLNEKGERVYTLKVGAPAQDAIVAAMLPLLALHREPP